MDIHKNGGGLQEQWNFTSILGSKKSTLVLIKK